MSYRIQLGLRYPTYYHEVQGTVCTCVLKNVVIFLVVMIYQPRLNSVEYYTQQRNHICMSLTIVILNKCN